jgi:glycerol uptake facilitator-like aquaporin
MLAKLLLSEFIGTFILTLGQTLAVSQDENGNQSMDFWKGLAGIYMGMLFSHAISSHLNPAVIYLMYLKDNKVGEVIVQYSVVQILGATAADLMSYYFNDTIIMNVSLPSEVPVFNGMLVETLASIFLYVSVLNSHNSSKNQVLQDLSVLSAVATGMAISGKMSKAGMNPAVVIGSQFTRALKLGEIDLLKQTPLYLISHYTSAHIALVVYNKMNNLIRDK